MIIAFIGGIFLGIFFFGGLYLTVEKMQKVKHPAIFMILSLLLRMAILLLGFYLLMNSNYQNLLVALVGVLISRFILIKKLGNKNKSQMKRGEPDEY